METNSQNSSVLSQKRDCSPKEKNSKCASPSAKRNEKTKNSPAAKRTANKMVFRILFFACGQEGCGPQKEKKPHIASSSGWCAERVLTEKRVPAHRTAPPPRYTIPLVYSTSKTDPTYSSTRCTYQKSTGLWYTRVMLTAVFFHFFCHGLASPFVPAAVTFASAVVTSPSVRSGCRLLKSGGNACPVRDKPSYKTRQPDYTIWLYSWRRHD